MASSRILVMPVRAHLPLSPAIRQTEQPMVSFVMSYSSQSRPIRHFGLNIHTRLDRFADGCSLDAIDDARSTRSTAAASSRPASLRDVSATRLTTLCALSGLVGAAAMLLGIGLWWTTTLLFARLIIFSPNSVNCCRNRWASASARNARASAASRAASAASRADSAASNLASRGVGGGGANWWHTTDSLDSIWLPPFINRGSPFITEA
mmetsp:Transcript_5165/g.15682  ORF Transcript_5165/g.15682 Transcript_5165/m.15682 type:complete len:208 (-) Transcript_5165:77-700(-)